MITFESEVPIVAQYSSPCPFTVDMLSSLSFFLLGSSAAAAGVQWQHTSKAEFQSTLDANELTLAAFVAVRMLFPCFDMTALSAFRTDDYNSHGHHRVYLSLKNGQPQNPNSHNLL